MAEFLVMFWFLWFIGCGVIVDTLPENLRKLLVGVSSLLLLGTFGILLLMAVGD